MDSHTPKSASRRDFLNLAGAVAAGTALAASGTQSALADEAAPETKTGYRETDHIRTYYQYLRF